MSRGVVLELGTDQPVDVRRNRLILRLSEELPELRLGLIVRPSRQSISALKTLPALQPGISFRAASTRAGSSSSFPWLALKSSSREVIEFIRPSPP